MKQITFEWVEQAEPQAGEVELEPETTEAVVVLMARALIVVVRAAEEDFDER